MSKDLPLSRVVDRLREIGVDFFVNSRGEPTVSIPDDPFQKDWPVDSQRLRDYVLSVYFEVNSKLPKPEMLAFLLCQVREDCRKGGRRLSDGEVLTTESEPIVQAIQYLMNDCIKLHDRTVEILRKSRALQEKGLIDQSKDITPWVNLYSRQLKRWTPALRGLGVEVELTHKEDGSYCTITRLPAFQVETKFSIETDDSSEKSSGKSSAVTPNKQKGLPLPDGADGKIRLDSPKAKLTLGGPGDGASLAADQQTSDEDEAAKGGAK